MTNNINNDLKFDLDCYIGCGYKEDKNKKLNEILEKFNSEKEKNSIKIILKCYKCRNTMNFNNVIHIYECINCLKIFCENCVIHCKECAVYTDFYEYIHCYNCKHKCFGVINNQLKDVNLKNNYDNEYFKNIIFDTYKKSTDCNNLEEMKNNKFIDKLKIGTNIKTFLKINSNDL